MLEISGLAKRYPTGTLALDGVDLHVGDGDLLALIGPSGAGKSTLIRCINRLVEPTSGAIIFDRQDITRLNARRLREARKQIGMIFQEYALVEQLTVMENVLSGRLGHIGFWRSLRRNFDEDDIQEAFRLLERLGLKDYVNTRADQLSGGQRQRVGIARALLQRPKLLLIDEPTASLDPKTAREIMRIIVELVQEQDVVAIVNIHDVHLAKMYTKRIVGLTAGRIVFDGSPAQLDTDALTSIYGEEDWEEGAAEVESA